MSGFADSRVLYNLASRELLKTGLSYTETFKKSCLSIIAHTSIRVYDT